MIQYFKLNHPYEFDINDILCGLAVLCSILTIYFGLVISWLGLGVALFNVGYDCIVIKRLNLLSLHLSLVVLNIYFLRMLYCG